MLYADVPQDVAGEVKLRRVFLYGSLSVYEGVEDFVLN
jgi:hypothetical protein